MGYSYHLPMPRGVLKIKSESRLRNRERYREVPVVRIGWTYFVWERKAVASLPAKIDKPTG